MEKIWAFFEKLLAPVLLMAIGGMVFMYVNFHVMEYKLDELMSWKSSGERCTKEDCSLMQMQIYHLESTVKSLQADVKELNSKN